MGRGIMNTATTHLVEYVPYPMRNERCAIGVLAHRSDGTFAMRAAQNLKKVRALNPACDVQALRDGLQAAAAEIQAHPTSLRLYADGVGGIHISPRAGRMVFQDEDEFEDRIKWALAAAVEPAKPVKERARPSISRLFMEVKNSFESFGWLAPQGQRIEAGLIVPRYSLSPEEGLTLDFAQQSKEKFVAVQTVDYRHNAQHKKTEASAKLLTLGIAPQILVPGVMRIGIFAGANEPEAHAGLQLAERTCNEIFIEESADDMRRFVDTIAAFMGQSSMPMLRTQ